MKMELRTFKIWTYRNVMLWANLWIKNQASIKSGGFDMHLHGGWESGRAHPPRPFLLTLLLGGGGREGHRTFSHRIERTPELSAMSFDGSGGGLRGSCGAAKALGTRSSTEDNMRRKTGNAIRNSEGNSVWWSGRGGC